MTGLAEALGIEPDRVVAVIEALRARNETVATAESLTGGLVCAVLTGVPGASAVVRGGLVVYASQLKVALAGVNGRALYEHGAVHPLIAEELAAGARDRCQASWGIGLTGVAGPDPQDGVRPGTVHIGVAGPGPVIVDTLLTGGDRHAVRAAAVRRAVELLQAGIDRSPSGR
ncbi:MAG TPA: CinA family protein [Actinophytocola sp.]|uniref:CinA family protein n=1 Tax=Actinophytocola sp. TaxID=1872138 RepID=UPI002DBE70B7|nr:CinA family protein [Actinophytocola sp.]HEU5470575.1 CinA family protein [Actinophytocola sp.]